MAGDKDLGAYSLYKAKGELGEPQWPNETYRELIELAFKGLVVDSMEHSVIRELDGKS